MHITLICADNENWAIGLRGLSSALKQAGHSTRIILTCAGTDILNDRGLASIRSLAEGSELIGVSSMSRSSKKAKSIINALKPLRKHIVWEGSTPP